MHRLSLCGHEGQGRRAGSGRPCAAPGSVVGGPSGGGVSCREPQAQMLEGKPGAGAEDVEPEQLRDGSDRTVAPSMSPLGLLACCGGVFNF